MRNKLSNIWTFFTRTNDLYARCCVCHQQVSCNKSTSNLKRHLEKKHNEFSDKLSSKEIEIHQFLQKGKKRKKRKIIDEISNQQECSQTSSQSDFLNNIDLSDSDHIEDIQEFENSIKVEEPELNIWDQPQSENDFPCNDEPIFEEGSLPTKKLCMSYRTDSKICELCGRKSEKAFDVIMEIKEQLDKRDEFEVFGIYVANQIRNMKNDKQQQRARQCISNILFNLDSLSNNCNENGLSEQNTASAQIDKYRKTEALILPPLKTFATNGINNHQNNKALPPLAMIAANKNLPISTIITPRGQTKNVQASLSLNNIPCSSNVVLIKAVSDNPDSPRNKIRLPSSAQIRHKSELIPTKERIYSTISNYVPVENSLEVSETEQSTIIARRKSTESHLIISNVQAADSDLQNKSEKSIMSELIIIKEEPGIANEPYINDDDS